MSLHYILKYGTLVLDIILECWAHMGLGFNQEEEMDFFFGERERVLFASAAKGYLVTSIKDKLEEAQFEVLHVETIENASSVFEEKVSAMVLYVDEMLVKNKQLLVFLKDRALEEDIPVFAIGDEADLQDVRRLLLGNVIRQEFRRPLNIKEMVQSLKDYIGDEGNLHKKKILAVDDSTVMLNSIKNWLGDKYQVSMAESGMAAIASLSLNRPDLILLDYEMPVCDGKQTLEMIRSEREFADIPVVFLTGKQDRESIMQVMGLGPAGYLLKTMKPDEVKRYVDRFFAKKRAEQRMS